MPDRIWLAPEWVQVNNNSYLKCFLTDEDGYKEYTRTDLAQSLADALEEAKSVIASINSGKQHKVELEDDVAYWQRGEWCEWAKNDVLPKIEAALANYRKGE